MGRMPLRIKRSAGFKRRGDDKTSAVKIASYAFRYQDKMQLWRPVDSSIEKIKNLIAQRDRVVNAITQLAVPVNELLECGCSKEAIFLEATWFFIIYLIYNLLNNLTFRCYNNLKSLPIKVGLQIVTGNIFMARACL